MIAEMAALGGSGGVIVVDALGRRRLQLQHARHVSRHGLARRPLGRDLRRRDDRAHQVSVYVEDFGGRR